MRFLKEEIQEALCLRHTPEIQERLDRGRVAVAGLGGLGSCVAVALARLGVGCIAAFPDSKYWSAVVFA